jgi:hypothetical protein
VDDLAPRIFWPTAEDANIIEVAIAIPPTKKNTRIVENMRSPISIAER